MTTTDVHGAPRRRKPHAVEFSILFGWHAMLSGAFIVAYLSGDEDTYAMHQFAGYLVLAAMVLRLVAGVAAPAGSPLRLPRPDLTTLRAWMAARGMAARGMAARGMAARGMAARGGGARALPRRPLLTLMAVLLLLGIGAAAGSGAVADFVPPVEAIHEAFGELALWIVVAHVALVVALHGVARWWRRPPTAASAACAERGRP